MRISAHLAVILGVLLLAAPPLVAQQLAAAPEVGAMCGIDLPTAVEESRDDNYALCSFQEELADASPGWVQFAAARPQCKAGQKNVKYSYKCGKQRASGTKPCPGGDQGKCCEGPQKTASASCEGEITNFKCRCSK